VSVEIRHLHGPEEAVLAVDLQRLVWGGDEAPAHVMLTAAHNGGLLAGAFVDGVLAGFVWGFLGFDARASPPRLKHCSHQLGVHPAYRNLGLGFLLKRFQWEFVRRQGLELVTWTYDPLLSTNAYLNIARLGAVCNTYCRNEYGDLDDDLNAGLATDRLQVDWWVNSSRVCDALERSAAQEEASFEDAYWLNPPGRDEPVLPPDAAHLAALPAPIPDSIAIAIPPDFQALRAADARLALEWRGTTRLAFELLFASGHTVVEFVRRTTYGGYLLQRGFDAAR
jgi:predicted GNAT superfamily acetyltransferase